MKSHPSGSRLLVGCCLADGATWPGVTDPEGLTRPIGRGKPGDVRKRRVEKIATQMANRHGHETRTTVLCEEGQSRKETLWRPVGAIRKTYKARMGGEKAGATGKMSLNVNGGWVKREDPNSKRPEGGGKGRGCKGWISPKASVTTGRSEAKLRRT